MMVDACGRMDGWCPFPEFCLRRSECHVGGVKGMREDRSPEVRLARLRQRLATAEADVAMLKDRIEGELEMGVPL